MSPCFDDKENLYKMKEENFTDKLRENLIQLFKKRIIYKKQEYFDSMNKRAFLANEIVVV